MSKEQEEYENAICKCGHPRNHHAGIGGFCYRSDCNCKLFTLTEVNK